MEEIINISLDPRQASDEKYYITVIADQMGIDKTRISSVKILRRSIDARGRDIKLNVQFKVYIDCVAPETNFAKFNYKDVSNKPEVIVVGAGPAGLFAALRLIELGIKPIVLERGKPVSERKRDIAMLHRQHEVNPESNYCFGEGGAGTFSDGKLYTRSQKRGNIQKILEILHYHGASDEILYEAHPHIGTDKLPGIITRIRETIENCGGKVLFNTKLVDFYFENERITSVITQKNDKIPARAVILATGHSARDIYELLFYRKILLEQKGFAVGLRVEHPQELIDKIQYHGRKREDFLPAASYNLVTQAEGRGVYSFCMCPGGFIVPSATASDEIVVNGMSPSLRNSPYANSGIVVEIRPEDLGEYSAFGVLAGIRLQQQLEQMAYTNGGYKQTAPAQRLQDFVDGKLSSALPATSYIPGVASSPVHFWLPEMISKRMRPAFVQFNKKMHGFLTNDAVVLGVESRTSSPIRIPRNEETFEHPLAKGLFPCGEGAGYAGGIVSSAVDGENCAEQVAKQINS